MSAPYKGNIVLNACPAQFGLDLSRGDVGVSKTYIIFFLRLWLQVFFIFDKMKTA